MAAANSSSKTNATDNMSPLAGNEGLAGNAGSEMLLQDPLLQPFQQPLQSQYFENSATFTTDPVAHPSSYSSPSTSLMLGLLAYQQSTSVTAACLTGLTSYLSGVDTQELPALIDLATLTPEQGTIITGATAGEKIGNIGSGDVTGRRDPVGLVVEEKIIIGTPNADPLNRTDAGMVYLIRTSQSLSAKVDLANFNVEQATGTKIIGGAAGDHCGKVVSKTTKDYNGDGIPDFAFSAPDADPYNRLSAGTIAIIYGTLFFDVPALNTVIDLKNLSSGIGLLIHGGNAGDYCGSDVELIDDVNGDNRAEVIFGCPSASAGTFRSKNGVTFIVYGTAEAGVSISATELDLSKFDVNTQGMKIVGDNSQDYSGQSVAFGDGDADGKGDVFIYAAGTSVINSKFYMLSSQAVPLKGLYDLSKFNNSQGILVNGGTGGYYADDLITTLRDVNGDAKNDFAAAFPLATANRLTGAGNVLVMYGSSSLPEHSV